MSRRHLLPYNKKDDVLQWLEENIQENYSLDGTRYNMSSVAQFVEWRSKDRESWILQVAGFPPRLYVQIKDPEQETWFLLRWG